MGGNSHSRWLRATIFCQPLGCSSWNRSVGVELTSTLFMKLSQTSPDEFIASLPDEVRADIATLDQRISRVMKGEAGAVGGQVLGW